MINVTDLTLDDLRRIVASRPGGRRFSDAAIESLADYFDSYWGRQCGEGEISVNVIDKILLEQAHEWSSVQEATDFYGVETEEELNKICYLYGQGSKHWLLTISKIFTKRWVR